MTESFKKRVYIAYPMTNYPNLNKQEGEWCSDVWKKYGYEAVDPGKLFDYDENTPQNIARKEALKLMLSCDFVAVSPMWKQSPESFVHMEIAVARAIGMPVFKAHIVPPTPLEETVLEEANRIIHGKREKDYGHPTVALNRIRDLWDSYLQMEKGNKPLSAYDVANLFILSKMARVVSDPFNRDSWVDMAGYAE
jgi:hypothetical protein